MATSKDYIEFITETVEKYDIGEVRTRSMFGEYILYINNKPIITVCDNMPYVKINKTTEELIPNATVGRPYDSAKEHYILDIEDDEVAHKVLIALEETTPLPKKKKKRE